MKVKIIRDIENQELEDLFVDVIFEENKIYEVGEFGPKWLIVNGNFVRNREYEVAK